MPIVTKEVVVYQCDRCKVEFDKPLVKIAAGSQFPRVAFDADAIVCHRCMTLLVDPDHDTKERARRESEARREAEREAERARERQARERQYQDDYQDRTSRGHGGATGRPFGSRSSLACGPSSAWNILQPQGGSLPACDHGRDSSLSASGARSGLLARLLNCQTPAT